MFEALTEEERANLHGKFDCALYLTMTAGDMPRAYAGPTMVDANGNDWEDELRDIWGDLEFWGPFTHTCHE